MTISGMRPHGVPRRRQLLLLGAAALVVVALVAVSVLSLAGVL